MISRFFFTFDVSIFNSECLATEKLIKYSFTRLSDCKIKFFIMCLKEYFVRNLTLSVQAKQILKLCIGV
jgi:hypothetical protein